MAWKTIEYSGGSVFKGELDQNGRRNGYGMLRSGGGAERARTRLVAVGKL